MILACPACATRFRVDDARIGASVRAVQCGVCGHRWGAGRARSRGVRPGRRSLVHLAAFLVWLLVALALAAVLLRGPLAARFPALGPFWERMGLPVADGAGPAPDAGSVPVE